MGFDHTGVFLRQIVWDRVVPLVRLDVFVNNSHGDSPNHSTDKPRQSHRNQGALKDRARGITRGRPDRDRRRKGDERETGCDHFGWDS